MKQYIIPPITSLIVTFAITNGDVMPAILNFLIAGAIPGTTFNLPFWLMMSIYCLAITAIVTRCLEAFFAKHQTARKAQHATTQLPRRRFGNI